MLLFRFLILVAVLFAFGLAAPPETLGQNEYSRLEIAAQFTNIRILDATRSGSSSAGFGARLDWNLTQRLALETTVDFSPKSVPTAPEQGGHTLQLLAGVPGKIIRSRRFAVYGVARPGFTYSSDALTGIAVTETSLTPPAFVSDPVKGSVAHFTLDLGRGVEFYLTSRLPLRAEVDDSAYFVGNTPLHFVTPQPLQKPSIRLKQPLLKFFVGSQEELTRLPERHQ